MHSVGLIRRRVDVPSGDIVIQVAGVKKEKHAFNDSHKSKKPYKPRMAARGRGKYKKNAGDQRQDGENPPVDLLIHPFIKFSAFVGIQNNPCACRDPDQTDSIKKPFHD